MDIHRELAVDSAAYSALISVMELHGISTVDLIMQSSDMLGLSKRLGRSIREIENFIRLIQVADEPAQNVNGKIQTFIKTGLDQLDDLLGGGIPVGQVTEIFGASGSAKSQFLFQVSCMSQLSVRNKVVFVNTETFLETKRLNEMIENADEPSISMKNIDYIYCQDLEILDHILYGQLPVKLEKDRSQIRCVIIDSIGHHLRKDESVTSTSFLKKYVHSQYEENPSNLLLSKFKASNEKQFNTFFKTTEQYDLRINKKMYLLRLYKHLANLAKKYDVAIVVSNQVTDQVNNTESHNMENEDSSVLDLDYQVGGMSGWDEKVIKAFQNSTVGSKLEESVSDILRNGRKRPHNTLDPESDPNEIKRTNYDTLKIDYDSVKRAMTHVRKHNLKTKVHVPILGYNWSKFIRNRILLVKTYRPLLNESVKSTATMVSSNSTSIQNLSQDAHQEKQYMSDLTQSFSSYISGWTPERYLKIVSSANVPSLSSAAKVKFKLSMKGLIEN